MIPFFSRPSTWDFPLIDPIFNDPFSLMPRDDFSSSLNRIHNLETMSQMPVTEVKDLGNQFQVLITPPPGIKHEDVHVNLENEVLRVTGHHSESETTPSSRRRTHQSFTRMFRVPATMIDDTKICAKWSGNRLELELPKKPSALEEGGRKIAIQGAPSSMQGSSSGAPSKPSAPTSSGSGAIEGEKKELPVSNM